MKSSFFLSVIALCFSPLAQAAVTIVTLELRDPTGVAGVAGENFEAGISYVENDVTFVAGASSTLGNGTAVYNATTARAGVNSGGISGTGGDDASQIEAGETLFIGISLGSTVTQVRLLEVDFAGVTDADDSAFVTYVDGSGGAISVTLDDTLDSVNGNGVWTPVGGILIQDGDSISFGNTSVGNYRLQTLTLEITTIPEPSIAMLGCGFGVLVLLRRRRV